MLAGNGGCDVAYPASTYSGDRPTADFESREDLTWTDFSYFRFLHDGRSIHQASWREIDCICGSSQ